MNRTFLKTMVLMCAMACIGFTVSAEVEDVKYKVKIKGARDGAVKKGIKESTVTWKLRKRPPSTEGQLRRRVEKDIPSIEAILEANGYYDGKVTTEIEERGKLFRVYLNIDQEEQYRFRNVELHYTGEPDPALLKIKPVLRRNKRVVAVVVFQEQQRILDLLTRNGYPFPVLEKRTVTVDRENKVVDLKLVFNPGQLAYFGPVDVQGLETLPRRYVKRQLPWREGDKYDAQDVKDFENKMLGTGLFGSVRVSPDESVAYTNRIPMSIQLTERTKRTVRLGVNYSDIGPGAKVYWEHRSFLGKGERLEASMAWDPIEYGGEVSFTRPGFLDANQSFVLNLDLSVEKPDAYDADKAQITGMVLRDFTSKIQGGIGLGYKYSQVEQFADSEKYGHVIIPLQAVVDNRNDKLNPVRGGQAFARTAFYDDTLGSENFFKTQLEGRKYFMLWNAFRLSSAFRVTLGSIDGTSVNSVPADERFYAGGGGSIRGYEYQAVGPSLDGTPTGGDKMLEFSAELRLQPGHRLGYVAFVDGGTVYNDLLHDDTTRSLRYGAGIGLRWFTTIGPLRADLAYPLNPDDSQVDRAQFYISLGQAF
jgi:translocation and assembly module TamA